MCSIKVMQLKKDIKSLSVEITDIVNTIGKENDSFKEKLATLRLSLKEYFADDGTVNLSDVEYVETCSTSQLTYLIMYIFSGSVSCIKAYENSITQNI